MADVIRKSTNKFTKGLVMDFSPENTRNEVLTHALNATLLTFNGNELSLLNDLGNARVETAYLPEGYMPVGTCEHGGIIYIVSYNPLEDKSLIGCFPSPERNISNDELGIPNKKVLRSHFQKYNADGDPDINGEILHNTLYVLLKNDNLNPGDKFLVCSNKEIYNEKLADLWVDKDSNYYEGSGFIDPKGFELIKNPIIALNVVSIEDDGKIVYLNSDLKRYDVINNYELGGVSMLDTYKYHILGTMAENAGVYDLASVDIDQYRNTLSSGYSVFKSKTSGKLAILAELVMIDSYSVTHSIKPRLDYDKKIIEGAFDIIIHTEVSPELNKDNYYIAPKLQYYYLDNSLGYIEISDSIKSNISTTLFKVENGINTGIPNGNFYSTPMNVIYTAVDEDVKSVIDPGGDKVSPTLGSLGLFNFPLPYTYHGRMSPEEGDAAGDVNNLTYTKFTEGQYHRITLDLVSGSLDFYTKEVLAKFYYYDGSGTLYREVLHGEAILEIYTYYVLEWNHTYYDAQRDPMYQNRDLYKVVSVPQQASETLIVDNTIEKFKKQEIHIYTEATNEDILTEEKLYYTEDGGKTYKLLTEAPQDGVTYYVLEIETHLVSIGYVVSSDTVSGTIYYYPSTKVYELASDSDKEMYYNFDRYPTDCPITLYRRESTPYYKEAGGYQKDNWEDLGIKLFYNTDYILIPRMDLFRDNGFLLFIVVPIDTFVNLERFVPNKTVNWINGQNKPAGVYPKDDPLFLYTLSDFIAEELPLNEDLIFDTGNYYKYKDVVLANIQLPEVVSRNGLDLPFKYDYTIVPCMNYGKLLHLAVSNTVDFSKLHAFNLSDFNTWKYYIDNNQLRLTFGADIYDTYEKDKVDGLVLEFYDLWGFAGSLEIVDKKSYSGIFTKIIPLNSLKALSTKKITANDYTESFIRNINITEKSDGYIYNNKKVSYLNATEGWNLPKTDNDCGTLYSNILYGVKAYIRRNVEGGKEFIHKLNFFLYTLPIYNDYYYTVNNFQSLVNPELNLMLTYKIKDSSNRTAYVQDGIVNGYNQTDKDNVSSYLGGFYDKDSLNLIKYYKYSGISDLYLEIGLKKEYESLNISYNPDINTKFTCNLLLVGDDIDNKGEVTTFTVNSGIEGLSVPNQILNYNNGLVSIDLNANQLGFGTSYSNKTVRENSAFQSANFINYDGLTPILIYYNFVVGYTATINDIRNTLVQATTICALFHKRPSGEYNYEDFGVYELTVTTQDGSDKTELLSSMMFYNEGTAETEVFGICRQIKTEGVNMLEECYSITSVETEALEIRTAGKLNAGDPLRQLVGHIGKLTFCQPHAHGLSDVNGVNIHGGLYNSYYGIPPELMYRDTQREADRTYGIRPTDLMYLKPKYNLSLNTKNSINYLSEFISTLDYNTIVGSVAWWGDRGDEDEGYADNITMREFTGFTGSEVSTFNSKMLETFKHVYAYNPDYDLLTVNVGNITLLNYNPYFTSNLLSTDSKLNFDELESLNNFILLGPIKFSKYLENLNMYSRSIDNTVIETTKDGSVLPQVQLTPNFDYCGTPENWYLISSLTYNTPTPKDLEQELEFSASNIIVIKHSNGENTYLEGIPNKKVLYGYNSDFDKMILLDVSNYTIEEDGTLKINNDGARETKNYSIEIDSNIQDAFFDDYYYFNQDFTNLSGETVNLELGFSLEKWGNSSSLVSLQSGSEGLILGTEYNPTYSDGSFTIRPYIYTSNNSSNYKYEAKITSLDVECESMILNDEISMFDYPIALYNQTYEDLLKLVSSRGQIVSLVGGSLNESTTIYWATPYSYSLLRINDNTVNQNSDTSINPDNYELIHVRFEKSSDLQKWGHVVGLIRLRIKRINFTITQISKLESTPESFIPTTRTIKYSKIDPETRKYVVLDDYKNTRLRGSSITLNDLLYEPNPDGHRLFMRNNLCVYNSNLRGKIYYRALDAEKSKYWKYKDTKYLNNLFLFTGPCFTEDNL